MPLLTLQLQMFGVIYIFSFQQLQDEDILADWRTVNPLLMILGPMADADSVLCT